MGNMSYCRFQNTLNDLVDCLDNLYDPVSQREAKAREELIRICRDIASEFPDDGDEIDLPVESF